MQQASAVPECPDRDSVMPSCVYAFLRPQELPVFLVYRTDDPPLFWFCFARVYYFNEPLYLSLKSPYCANAITLPLYILTAEARPLWGFDVPCHLGHLTLGPQLVAMFERLRKLL